MLWLRIGGAKMDCAWEKADMEIWVLGMTSGVLRDVVFVVDVAWAVERSDGGHIVGDVENVGML